MKLVPQCLSHVKGWQGGDSLITGPGSGRIWAGGPVGGMRREGAVLLLLLLLLEVQGDPAIRSGGGRDWSREVVRCHAIFAQNLPCSTVLLSM